MDIQKILHALGENLLTPIPLCFALGIFCKVIHGGIKIPKELYYSISIFLLMSIGFIGGHELAKEVNEHGITTIWQPALVTLVLGCVTPITAFASCAIWDACRLPTRPASPHTMAPLRL